MSVNVYLTTNWSTRGKGAKALSNLIKYTENAVVTVVQNGASPRPMDLWLKAETGEDNFEFIQYNTTATHGGSWNLCVYNSMYEWSVIINDSHYPTDNWETFFTSLTKKHKHKMYLLDSFGGTEAFAIHMGLWQKTMFNEYFISRKAIILDMALKIGFMENLPDKVDLVKHLIFPYYDYYGEPLFDCDDDDHDALSNAPITELNEFWRQTNDPGSIEGLDCIHRSPIV